jgi:hypothetical protein
MENNVNYYNASVKLLEAASWLRGIEDELSNLLLDKADYLTNKIVVIDEEELKKVKDYEHVLKSKQ